MTHINPNPLEVLHDHAAKLDQQPDNEDAEAVVGPGSVRVGLVDVVANPASLA